MNRASPPPHTLRVPVDPEWTPRQRQVLDLLAKGRTNPEIAEALGISRDGAKWHVSEVLSKLGVESREEAAEYWRARNGLRLRFTRVLRALVPGAGWVKVAGGVAGVAVLAGVTVVVVVGLRGSNSASLAGSPSPTPPANSAAAAATAVCGNTDLPPPGPSEPRDPWLRARTRLSQDVPILRPATVPSRFDAGTLQQACVEPPGGVPGGLPAGPIYTVWYRNGDESLVLSLGVAWDWNFPGPPTSVNRDVAVRRTTGTLTFTEGQMGNGPPTLNARMLSWQENGYRFEVRSLSNQITSDDLVRIAESLAPVP